MPDSLTASSYNYPVEGKLTLKLGGGDSKKGATKNGKAAKKEVQPPKASLFSNFRSEAKTESHNAKKNERQGNNDAYTAAAAARERIFKADRKEARHVFEANDLAAQKEFTQAEKVFAQEHIKKQRVVGKIKKNVNITPDADEDA
jgi:hypothetical protein